MRDKIKNKEYYYNINIKPFKKDEDLDWYFMRESNLNPQTAEFNKYKNNPQVLINYINSLLSIFAVDRKNLLLAPTAADVGESDEIAFSLPKESLHHQSGLDVYLEGCGLGFTVDQENIKIILAKKNITLFENKVLEDNKLSKDIGSEKYESFKPDLEPKLISLNKVYHKTKDKSFI